LFRFPIPSFLVSGTTVLFFGSKQIQRIVLLLQVIIFGSEMWRLGLINNCIGKNDPNSHSQCESTNNSIAKIYTNDRNYNLQQKRSFQNHPLNLYSNTIVNSTSNSPFKILNFQLRSFSSKSSKGPSEEEKNVSTTSTNAETPPKEEEEEDEDEEEEEEEEGEEEQGQKLEESKQEKQEEKEASKMEKKELTEQEIEEEEAKFKAFKDKFEKAGMYNRWEDIMKEKDSMEFRKSGPVPLMRQKEAEILQRGYELPHEIVPAYKKWGAQREELRKEIDSVSERCYFCQYEMVSKEHYRFDAMNVPLYSRFLSLFGSILPRTITGNCAKHQRKVARAVKKARHMGLYSYRNGFAINSPFPHTKGTDIDEEHEIEDHLPVYFEDESKSTVEAVKQENQEKQEEAVPKQ